MSNFLSYLHVFSVLFQLLIGVNNPLFKPGKRFEHTATIVDNKLFILGGFGEKEGKEFFYLDVSSPFTTLKPSWDDLTDINTLEAHWGATSVNGGADNSSLILYGGMQYNKDSSHSNFPLIHIFDAQNNSWSVPEVPGQEQIFYLTGSGVIDHSGQMYTLEIIHQMMVVFDTIDLTLWKKSSINNIFMTFYVAVLLPDQNIIYFSDSDGADPNLSEVLLYNTIDDRWRVQETIGNIPSNRSDFSAVLALDGQRVIIFGGMNENTMELIPGEDALYILEMKNFEWYIPKVSGNFPARSNHKANIIGKYMVVTFGLFYFDGVHILLLDISNNDEYIWTTEFTNMAIQIKSNIFYFMIVIFNVLYHLL